MREPRWDPRKSRRFSIKLEEVPVSGRLDPGPKHAPSISSRLNSKESVIETVAPAKSIRYLEDDDLNEYGTEVLGGRTRH